MLSLYLVALKGKKKHINQKATNLMDILALLQQAKASNSPPKKGYGDLQAYIVGHLQTCGTAYTTEQIRQYVAPCLGYLERLDTLTPDALVGFDMIERSIKDKWIMFNHEERKIDLTMHIVEMMIQGKPIEYQHVIIGDGTTGTHVHKMLTANLPTNQVLVVANQDVPMQWRKDNTGLLGQTVHLHMPAFYTNKAELHPKLMHNIGNSLNDYGYVSSDVFLSSVFNEQYDQNMYSLDTKITGTEKRSDGKIILNAEIKILDQAYRFDIICTHVHFCTGIGNTRYLSDNQISKELSSQFIQEGRLVYGNDNGRPSLNPKARKVCIIGAGARACAIAHQYCTEKMPNENLEIYFITRNPDELDRVSQLNRCFYDVVNKLTSPRKIKIRIDSVKKISESLSETPIIEFDSGLIMEFDQVVISIGQDLSQTRALYQNLGEFSLVHYHGIPVGMTSANKKVFMWGPASTDFSILPGAQAKEAEKNLWSYLESLPRESATPASILPSSFRIQMMYFMLMRESVLPRCDKRMLEYDFRTVDETSLTELFKKENKVPAIAAAQMVMLLGYRRRQWTDPRVTHDADEESLTCLQQMDLQIQQLCRGRGPQSRL